MKECSSLIRQMTLEEYCDFVLAGRPGFWKGDSLVMKAWLSKRAAKPSQP